MPRGSGGGGTGSDPVPLCLIRISTRSLSRKWLKIADALAQEGIAREKLDRVRSPMGLDIGALTPEEIAVAVVAEHRLPGPFAAGWMGNVFAGVSLDGQSLCCEYLCGCLRSERIHLQLSHLGQQPWRYRVDAMDDFFC